jgi:hypothetical protein
VNYEMHHLGQQHQFTEVASKHCERSFQETRNNQNSAGKVLCLAKSSLSRHPRQQGCGESGSMLESLSPGTSLASTQTFATCYLPYPDSVIRPFVSSSFEIATSTYLIRCHSDQRTECSFESVSTSFSHSTRRDS